MDWLRLLIWKRFARNKKVHPNGFLFEKLIFYLLFKTDSVIVLCKFFKSKINGISLKLLEIKQLQFKFDSKLFCR